MKVVIGIITHQRKSQLLRLLQQLGPQLSTNDYVWVLENGQGQLNKSLLSSIHSHIKLFFHPTASIPISRNFIFTRARQRADLLVFLDDDVLIAQNWLRKIKIAYEEAQDKGAQIIQGNFLSFPPKNIYAKTTEILSQLWIKANITSSLTTTIIDTKHVGFLLKDFPKISQLFHPSFRFASDIAAAAVLTNEYKMRILFFPQLNVYHQERTSWWQFVQHRFRLSTAYRAVLCQYPQEFNSVKAIEKFKQLWLQLKFPPLQKIFICATLLGVYGVVWVSNLITSFRRR
jgi:glycosyltransferase involved in cell wall biosynthesis